MIPTPYKILALSSSTTFPAKVTFYDSLLSSYSALQYLLIANHFADTERARGPGQSAAASNMARLILRSNGVARCSSSSPKMVFFRAAAMQANIIEIGCAANWQGCGPPLAQRIRHRHLLSYNIYLHPDLRLRQELLPCTTAFGARPVTSDPDPSDRAQISR